MSSIRSLSRPGSVFVLSEAKLDCVGRVGAKIHDAADIQDAAGFRRGIVLFICRTEQHDRLRFQLPIHPACADDGFDFSRQPGLVACPELTGLAHGLLFFDHYVGGHHHDPRLVGRDTTGAGVAGTRRSVQSCQGCCHRGPYPQPADVAGRVSRHRRGVVPDVAVKNVEWPGRSFPNVHRGALCCCWSRSRIRKGSPSFSQPPYCCSAV